MISEGNRKNPVRRRIRVILNEVKDPVRRRMILCPLLGGGC